MSEFLTVFALTALSGNLLMTKTVGADWLERINNKKGMGLMFYLLLTVSSVLSSAGMYLVRSFTEGHAYASLVATVIIGIVLCVVYFGLSRLKGMEDINEFIPMLAADSALLVIALSVADESASLTDAVLLSLGMSVGLCVALGAVACIALKIRFSAPPKAFSGMPLLIVAVAILAMAFSVFNGINIS